MDKLNLLEDWTDIIEPGTQYDDYDVREAQIILLEEKINEIIDWINKHD
jgi:hypothetical protein